MNLVRFFGDHKINIKKTNNGGITFCGKDVANALGYVRTDQAIRAHVLVEDKIVVKNLTPGNQGSGQNRSRVYITECGVYSLIFSSKKEDAKKFKRWVFEDVLPSIRKTGGYVIGNQLSIMNERFTL